MEENNRDILFRRILVAMDTSEQSRSALEAAAWFARLMDAELRGIFVQDEIWYRLGRLSISREISEITGRPRDLPENYMEQQVRVLEQRIHRQVKRICREFGVSHTWNSTKGSIENQVLQAAENADLITIGRSGHSHSREYKLGTTAQAIIRKADKPVLLLDKSLNPNKACIVVYDGTPAGQRALKTGLHLARENQNELHILGLAQTPESVQDLKREVEREVQQAEIPVRLHLMEQHNLWNLTRLLHRIRGGLLIIPKKQPLIKDEWLGRIIHTADCPLLLMV